ncbi:transketolase family protein [Lachnospiraceae bacterium KK002]
MNTATREAYGNTLVELIDKNKDVVVLDADLAHATKTLKFSQKCPERFFNMGIAEADMIGTAAGLATCGKIPFASTFAVFATGRAFDQVRNTVCYPNLNVKIVGSHAGITVGPDGGSHEAIEDIAIMRSLPDMSVIVPSDDVEARAAVLAAAEIKGPMYLRMARVASPTYHKEDYVFEFGKGELVKDGKDVTIIATGIMVPKALEAARALAEDGIEAQVVNIHTIKPLDEKMVVECAKKTGRVITVEEATIYGGLGSAVCEVLSDKYPVPVRRIGVQDKFGKSGDPDKLLEEYGLTSKKIMETAQKMLRGE